MDKGSDTDIPRLESGMSFLQVKAFMTMKEKVRQVRSTICVERLPTQGSRLLQVLTTPTA
jgi:hypothetical protein